MNGKFNGTVYEIVCKPILRKYVGATTQPLYKRLSNHWWRLRKGIHANPELQKDFDFWGEDAFTVQPLVEHITSPKRLDTLETRLIAQHRSMIPNGYNFTTGGKMHAQFSDEMKQHISAGTTGRTLSPEHIAKIRDRNIGRTLTSEHKAKISLANKGRKRTAKFREECRQRKLGVKRQPFTELHKQHMSESRAHKTFTLVNPTGETVVVNNMNKFCRDKNMSKSAVYGVLNGRFSQTQGWRRTTSQQEQ